MRAENGFNALPELKENATGIIGCNEEDAVANYLKERMGE